METIYRYTVTEDGKTLSFLDRPENKDFIKALIRALEQIDIELTYTADLFKSDELAIKAISNMGELSIVRDLDGYYLIITDSPKKSSVLDVILSGNQGFERVD